MNKFNRSAVDLSTIPHSCPSQAGIHYATARDAGGGALSIASPHDRQAVNLNAACAGRGRTNRLLRNPAAKETASLKQPRCPEPVSFARLQSGAHMRQYGRNGAMRPRRGARATRCVRMSLCDCVRARMRQCGRGGAATAHTRALVKRAGGRVMRFRSSEMVYPLGLSSHRLSDISLRRVFGISLARLFLTPFLGLIPTPVVSLSPCVSP